MKKISTVTARQSKNFREQELTIGLDLGDRSSWYCVLDEAGEVVLEQVVVSGVGMVAVASASDPIVWGPLVLPAMIGLFGIVS
jgi:hypothetical protein